jgi:hypothetical protein
MDRKPEKGLKTGGCAEECGGKGRVLVHLGNAPELKGIDEW